MSTPSAQDQEFPFTHEEWARVSDATRGLVETTVDENDPGYAAAVQQMRTTIAELRAKYGDHPVLLETLGDFEDDVAIQLGLYRAAIERATILKLTSYSVRLTLARVLISDCNEPAEALEQLRVCSDEVASHGDQLDREEHTKLVKMARGQRMRASQRPSAH